MKLLSHRWDHYLNTEKKIQQILIYFLHERDVQNSPGKIKIIKKKHTVVQSIV